MSSQFDATASMLGYLFQVRLALLDSLKRLRAFGSFSVTLEPFDVSRSSRREALLSCCRQRIT